jgi:hypothetical protein
MAKKQLKAKRPPSATKAKRPVRVKSKAAPKKAASRKPARKVAPTAVKKKPSARKPSMPVSKAVQADVEPRTTTPTEPGPTAFWDPQAGKSEFPGDSKAHTKPEDQRAHIRMTAPRTWSNRQPGRG